MGYSETFSTWRRELNKGSWEICATLNLGHCFSQPVECSLCGITFSECQTPSLSERVKLLEKKLFLFQFSLNPFLRQ